jgi:signal transduction histidine kinase
MAKHTMIKAKDQLFSEHIALNMRMAETEKLLNKKRSIIDGEAEPIANHPEKLNIQPPAGNAYYVLADGMNEGALTLSRDAKIIYCNKHFAQLINKTVEDVVGSHLDKYIQTDDIEKLNSLLNSDHLAAKYADIKCLSDDSAPLVTLRLSVNSLAQPNDFGNVFLIAYDISDFKRIEAELQNEQLNAAKNEAERTSRLVRVNEELGASRMATLSMMEDAVEAKNELEASNKKLTEEIIERKRSELVQQVLFSISNAALITRDIEELISIIRSELGKLLDTKNFYIAFYDKDTDTLSTPYIEDEKDELSTWSAAKSLTGYVIKNRTKLLVNREEIEELIKHGVIELVGTGALLWLGVPLEVDEQVIGAFVVQSYDNVNAYDTKDLDMLEFISHQISISIQRKKSVQDLTTALIKAEESDRLKTAFLQNISHEIRTPMNAILGFSELLNDPELGSEMRTTYTDIIGKSGNHLLTILEDIINISELEAGKEALRTGKTHLNPLLRDMYEQYKLKAGKKNLELKLYTPLDDDQVFIITDETKLIQILSNLLNNALKFTKEGSINFGYTLKNGKLEFYVEDSGVGISPDKNKEIFDRFKQVEIVLSSENGGRGLGLGLSISKAYVELMGGSIWLKSELGKGSTFYFSIPYTPLLHQKNQERLITEMELNNANKQKTILIAEEVKRNYILVSELFAGLHANIIWVSNGLEALQTCKAIEKIDMVIMDINMTKMDGFETTRLMRVFMPDLAIIAQSSQASKNEQKEAFASGFSEYLVKPLEVSQIIALTNKYMDNYFNIYSIQNLAS